MLVNVISCDINNKIICQQEWHCNSSEIRAANMTSWIIHESTKLLSIGVLTAVAEISYCI